MKKVLLLFLVVAGCSSSVDIPESLLLPTANENFYPPSQVSSAEVRQDLIYMHSMLLRAYAGKLHFGEKTVNRFIKDMAKDLVRESYSPTDVCQQLGASYRKYFTDSHMNFRVRAANGAFVSCRKLTPRNPQVGANIHGQAGGDKPWVHLRLPDKNISIFGIPTWNSNPAAVPSQPVWREFLKELQTAKDRGDAIILDMRRNRGGFTQIPIYMAALLWGLDVSGDWENSDYVNDMNFLVPGLKATWTQIRTPEGHAAAATSFLLNLLPKLEAGQPIDPNLQKFWDQQLEWYRQAREGKLKPRTERQRLPKDPAQYPNHFRGPLYVLADAQCASACEIAISLLARLPGYRLVGENTAGALHHTGIGMFVLPKTRIVFSFGLENWSFENGYFETTGFPPDVPVTPGGDALQEALKLL